MALSRLDFNRFIHAKRSPLQCLCCGQSHVAGTPTDYGIAVGLHDDPLAPPVRLRMPFEEDGQTGVHEFYVTICTNCGFSSLFHRKVVESWVQANPATGGVS
jgi:hypothetical protein